MRMRSLIAVGAVLVLGACGDTWLGEREVPLPGERISVMLHERTLAPDPGVDDHEILLPPPAPNTAWPQDGGYPNHAMHHLALNEPLARAWGADIGAGSGDEERLVSPPIIAEGRVYTMDTDNVVRAFLATDGAEVWAAGLTPAVESDGHFGGGLAFEGGRVFATTGFGHVVALDAANGGEIWRRSLRTPMRAPPAVRGGRVFATTVDNKLYALSAFDGEDLWRYEGFAETASLLGNGAPAVDAGIVVAPFSSGELTALRVDTGTEVWSDAITAVRRTDPVATLSDIRGRPIIDRGRVFAVSHSGLMAAIDLATGRRLWEREVGSLESPWIVGDYLYVLTTDGELVALSREDGRIFWVTALPRWLDPEDRTGRIMWTAPLVASDRLIVAGSHGIAVTISPYTGELLGRVEMPSGVSIAPVAADGTLYFLTESGQLVAYR